MNPLLILIGVVLLDYRIGDPPGLPHPIIYIGRLISATEKKLRAMQLATKMGGGILFIVTVTTTLVISITMVRLAQMVGTWLETVVVLVLLTMSLAATCLKKEVMKVAEALESGDLVEGRLRLSYLVGRDTDQLSEEEVIKAAIETTAENTIDGVLAPLFYIMIGMVIGHPVAFVFLYKAINTLDSMVGYIQEPYKEIGYVSAKMDDVMNYLPGRIGSFFMLLAGGLLDLNVSNGYKIWRRDHGNHKSPNAGHPESVVAGLLDIQLGGTHTYFNEVLVKPTIGDSVRKVSVTDIKKTTQVMYASEFLMLIVGCILFMIFS